MDVHRRLAWAAFSGRSICSLTSVPTGEQMTDSTAHLSKFDHLAYSPLPKDRLAGDHPLEGGMPQLVEQLITPSWAEVESARDRCNRHADRLRFWQWWFVGMFTFYTILVGILLLELTVGI
jgi:hypothetical protein